METDSTLQLLEAFQNSLEEKLPFSDDSIVYYDPEYVEGVINDATVHVLSESFNVNREISDGQLQKRTDKLTKLMNTISTAFRSQNQLRRLAQNRFRSVSRPQLMHEVFEEYCSGMRDLLQNGPVEQEVLEESHASYISGLQRDIGDTVSFSGSDYYIDDELDPMYREFIQLNEEKWKDEAIKVDQIVDSCMSEYKTKVDEIFNFFENYPRSNYVTNQLNLYGKQAHIKFKLLTQTKSKTASLPGERKLEDMLCHYREEVVLPKLEEMKLAEFIVNTVDRYEAYMQDGVPRNDFLIETQLLRKHDCITANLLEVLKRVVPANKFTQSKKLFEKKSQERFKQIKSKHEKIQASVCASAQLKVNEYKKHYEEFIESNRNSVLDLEEVHVTKCRALLNTFEVELLSGDRNQWTLVEFTTKLQNELDEVLAEVQREQSKKVEKQMNEIVFGGRNSSQRRSVNPDRYKSKVNFDTIAASRFIASQESSGDFVWEGAFVDTLPSTELRMKEDLEKIFDTLNDSEIAVKGLKTRPVGISFGSMIFVATYQDGEVKLAPNDCRSNWGTHSIIAHDENKGFVFGSEAQVDLWNNKWKEVKPENRVYDLMRILGRSMKDEDIQRGIKTWEFNVIDSNGIPQIKFNGELYFPEELAAKLLAQILFHAEIFLHLGCTVRANPTPTSSSVVIAVPSSFQERQIEAVVNAGVLAGVTSVSIIDEASAAALAYSVHYENNSEKLVVVANLRSKMLEVSVLRVSDDAVEILEMSSSRHLGGDAFTDAITSYFIGYIDEKSGYDLSSEKVKKIGRPLWGICEWSKIMMTYHDNASQTIGARDGKDFRLELTKSLFDELTRELLEDIRSTVDDCLKRAQVRKEDVDDVILAGKGSNFPQFQETLRNFFGGKELKQSIPPEKVVAHGAAIQAALMKTIRKR